MRRLRYIFPSVSGVIIEEDRLIDAAREALEFSRASYSGFRVGAAIMTSNGDVFTGCNIESSSYGLSICAERCALFKALSQGADDFVKIAIAVEREVPVPPCGACRQLLWDYAPKIEIILAGMGGNIKKFMLKELYPHPFGGDNMS